jgi:hypothetical protein
MTNEQKHEAIRQALAELGYLTRSEKGYALYIAPKVSQQVQAA